MNTYKIIVTVGPASLQENIINKMDDSGVDIFRINLSHTSIKDLSTTVDLLKSWTNKTIALDSEGAQLRTGRLKSDSSINIKTGDVLELVSFKNYIDNKQIPLNQESLSNIFYSGEIIKIDFNNVVLQIIEFKNDVAIARVLEGGKINSNKGISIDRSIKLNSFTNKDYKAFKMAEGLGIKTFFLSFCSNKKNVMEIRSLFNHEINVISKIENELGLRNLKSICKVSNGILVDRGDLSRDISLEKIAFAQEHILKIAQEFNIDKYIATNLMENMIENENPTRAEINDIFQSIKSGANGLVLAAETAIGNHPINCVRILSRVLNEIKFSKIYLNKDTDKQFIDHLLMTPNNRIVEPHGGNLIQQFKQSSEINDIKDYSVIDISPNVESDLIQITEGTYSPLENFMNLEEVNSVLNKNNLLNGEVWTLPIIFLINANEIKKIPKTGTIGLRSKTTKLIIGLLDIESIEKLNKNDDLLKSWFGTSDSNHPGVSQLIAGGDYVISGKPFLLKENVYKEKNKYSLTPKQSRDFFYQKRWHNIVGFHTRNIIHRGHEFIQKKALKMSNADAILISPVTGLKKRGDFKSNVIINTYEHLIKNGFYKPYGSLLGSFNTYSRYCGPREAVFTALCRKNYGCNYFIVGRDQTGVKSYYKPNESIDIFNELDLGINILSFNKVYYNSHSDLVTDEIIPSQNKKSIVEISATKIRKALINGEEIPDYIIRNDVAKSCQRLFAEDPKKIFY